jgi:hypothetical protein
MAGKAYAMIQQIAPMVAARLAEWQPLIEKAETIATTDNMYTRSMCAANVVYGLSRLIAVLESTPEFGPSKPAADDFDVENSSTLVTKAACIAASTLVSCGYQIGLSPAALTGASAISVTCAVGSSLASMIQCETARNCCLAARDAARGIAMPAVDPQSGAVSRMCCTCTRQVWDDRTWPRRDVLLSESPWRSVTSDGSEPSEDCEWRVGKTFPHALPEAGGRHTYSSFKDCRRVMVTGPSCF